MRLRSWTWNRGHWAALALAAVCAVMLSEPASADLVSVSGNGEIIDPTLGGTTANFFQTPLPDPKIKGWNEAQGVVLSKDVYVDIDSSGTFDSKNDLKGFQEAKVAQGTRVDSHLLYFDPVSAATVQNVTFTFSGKILGVIVESDRFFKDSFNNTDYFVDSDFLRNASTPTTNYATGHFNNRGMEMGGTNDSISVSVSGQTVRIDIFGASSPGDQVRVLTAAVPEPSTFLLFGVPFAIMGVAYPRRNSTGTVGEV